MRDREPEGYVIVNVEIVSRNQILKPESRELIEKRVAFALQRFETQIERVWIALVDINGERGGEDKQCRVVINLTPSGSVLIDHVADSIESASSLAIERAGHAVSRTVERRHRVNGMRVASRHNRNSQMSEPPTPE